MLVVDDSSVIRRLVRVALEKDAAFEVAGVAANGKIALGMIERLRPDALTLYIEMPEMNGLETLEQIRKLYPEVRVVMFSNLTVSGAKYTFEALAQGADDYVAKPANVAAHQVNVERLGDELTAKIKNLFQTIEVPIEQIPRANVRGPKHGVAVVAIGVSTGGPNALAEIIPALPLELPCPVVVTQHMPAMFTRLLADRLNSKSSLTVVEAEHDQPVEAGNVLIAPGGRHLCFRRQGTKIVVNLTDGPMENSCKPAVDVMLRSVCEIWGGECASSDLNGDGRRRVEWRRVPKTSWVDGARPGPRIERRVGNAGACGGGWAGRSGSPTGWLRRYDQTVQLGGRSMTYSTRLSATNASPSISSANFGFLCRTIYDDSGIVLDQSKMYLFQARLTPLASSEEFKTLDDLCDLIRAVGGRRIRDRVVDAMTTNETLLFRDGRPFDALRGKIIPELTSRQSDRTLRIWSATCSTGQEAYSIAMIWRELDIAGWSMRLVGTDLSASVLDQARQGRYHQHEVKRGLPPDYLEKYFDAEGTDWTIKPEIRAMVEWEKFNLRDSMAAMEPFDIILCRNVLIYFDDETKGRILENLRRALKPGGYLLLGSTESTLSTNSRFKRLAVGSANAYQSIAAGW